MNNKKGSKKRWMQKKIREELMKTGEFFVDRVFVQISLMYYEEDKRLRMLIRDYISYKTDEVFINYDLSDGVEKLEECLKKLQDYIVKGILK